jgi:hypothetical protein
MAACGEAGRADDRREGVPSLAPDRNVIASSGALLVGSL